jgi:hypothetical protein
MAKRRNPRDIERVWLSLVNSYETGLITELEFYNQFMDQLSRHRATSPKLVDLLGKILESWDLGLLSFREYYNQSIDLFARHNQNRTRARSPRITATDIQNTITAILDKYRDRYVTYSMPINGNFSIVFGDWDIGLKLLGEIEIDQNSVTFVLGINKAIRQGSIEFLDKQSFTNIQTESDLMEFSTTFETALEQTVREMSRKDYIDYPRRKNPVATGTLLAFGIGYFLGKK